MFVYLSKKIAIPNNVNLTALSWNTSKGFIACGGENGLVKILKLDPQNDGHVRGIAAPTTLTMNESLEEHKNGITKIVWNEKFDKMTSADDTGVIIVWILFKNSWHQEMINNTNKCRVRGMKWNSDGERICIAYEDGSVIVGSVNGSRIWGKNVPDKLAHVEWSPDSRFIMFGLLDGQIHLYDYGGNKIADVKNFCQTDDNSLNIVGIDWYKGDKGYLCKNCPTLAICFSNGCCQIMRSEVDEYPVLINTGIEARCLAWNGNGTILAIAGLQSSHGTNKESNLIQFYNPFGFHLRTLKIPSKDLRACSWDGDSLRLAVAVDSSIYFANIRPNYIWAYCQDTVVFAYTRPERFNYFVTYWNAKNDSRVTKSYGKLKTIISNSVLCCIIFQENEDVKNKYTLQVCNSIGTPIDTTELIFEPLYYAMTLTHVIFASSNVIFSWQFKKPETLLSIDSQVKRQSDLQLFRHIDNTARSTDSSNNFQDDLKSLLKKPSDNPICCICASRRTVIIARESGHVNQYAMPMLDFEVTYGLRSRPFKMDINCTGTRIASIDFGGTLTFFDLEKSYVENNSTEPKYGKIVENFEHKDVWDMKFSEDNPILFVMMEKAKLRIIQDTESEEPISFSGYICEFKGLEVKAALLDEIVKDYDNFSKDLFVVLEAKILRDCRKLLEDGQLEMAQKFIDEHPHNKMWQMLAEYALEKLDLETAEKAFVRYNYYPGIKFVKKLQKIQNNNLKLAEISVYFGRHEEAEKRFMAMDRPDLTISMLKSIGEWTRVLQLMKAGDAASDAEMNEAWNAIGNQYFDKHNWMQAVNFFTQGRCYEKLVECYYYLEDYSGLESLAESLPENSPLLPEIAEIFFNAGMCEQAVFAYVKCDQAKNAIDCCINLNHWQTAIELSKNRDMSDISEMLSRYAKQLLESKCYVQAVELYRRAGCFLEAAKIIQKLMEDEAKKSKNFQKLKKMGVLVGLLIEQHHEQNKLQAKARLRDAKGQDATSALNGMLQEEFVGVIDSKLLDRPWHWAEAFHFFLLAQRQLFQKFYDAAMRTSKLLSEYEDVIPPKDIYSLMAICSIHNRAFGTCSKAFTKLETLDSFTATEKEHLIQLTFRIFTKYTPSDPLRAREYDDMENVYEGDSKIPICVVSGQPITQGQFWMCPVCKHAAHEDEINKLQNCPMCHSPA